MLKNQTVNHVSEHLSAICPVYTVRAGLGPAHRQDRHGNRYLQKNVPGINTVNPAVLRR